MLGRLLIFFLSFSNYFYSMFLLVKNLNLYFFLTLATGWKGNRSNHLAAFLVCKQSETVVCFSLMLNKNISEGSLYTIRKF